MKNIIFALIVFATISSEAYEGFRCIPSMRDTRFQVVVQEKTIEVMVTNPMGYNFMPQFDGPSTSFQISFNKMQSQDLMDLGDQFTFSWPKESCQLDTKLFTLTCEGPANNLFKTVKGFGITSTQITEKYQKDTYDKRKFRFSFEKDNLYFVSLVFDVKNCEAFK